MRYANIAAFCFVIVLIIGGPVEGKKQRGRKANRRRGPSVQRNRKTAGTVNVTAPISGLSLRISGGGNNATQGLLEVYHGGQWGVVCDDGWDIKDADVACRELGFIRGAEGAPGGSVFGSGQWSKQGILYSRVSCTGQEEKLQLCPYSTKFRCTLSSLASVVCRKNNGCDDGWIAGQEGCYLLDKGGQTFPQVTKRCRKKKGHLASIETAAENDFLSVILHALDSDTKHWIIGGKRQKKKWLWIKQMKLPKTGKRKGRKAKNRNDQIP